MKYVPANCHSDPTLFPHLQQTHRTQLLINFLLRQVLEFNLRHVLLKMTKRVIPQSVDLKKMPPPPFVNDESHNS